MDWVVKQWDSVQKSIQASRPSSSAASAINFPFERPEKINDHIYELHRPEGRPSIEIVFCHGLQFEGSKEAYLTTWLSAGGSELWPTWILKGLPNARILFVSYDACAQRNNEEGRMDMFLTCENLVASLTEGRGKIGGDGCPVIFVGHSIGGLVIKELCVKLHSIVSKVLPHSPRESVQNLLQNIRGLFYYACPHLGSRLADANSDFPKGPLFECITTLNHEAQRRNEEFRELHKKYGWKTYGIVEGRPTTLGRYEDLFVTEASARCDVDDFFTYNADHFNICRPQSRTSSNFSLLSNFVASVLEQVQDERSPKMSIPNGVHGLEGRVKAIMDLLKQGARRLGIVGMGGIGKTTLARAVYDTISASFEYTCFLRDVKKSVAIKDNLEYLQNKIIKCLSDSRGYKVKKPFNWTKLKGRKVLFVLDDVDCESHVRVMLESDGFSDESCVIVTSRESRFLYAESFQCYFVEALDQEDSKRVFCLNAFHKEVAQPGYELRVARFTKRCGGLPLALRVAGKYLFDQKEGVWDEGLEKLKQSEPLNGSKEDDLSSVLMVCYQSLAKKEQEMFLDVATCFHNQDVETLKRAWSVCGWASPESGLGNLVDKGFVTIEDTITIKEDSTPSQCLVRMHEVLRDLGRSIACTKTENVGTHTRLCYDLSNPLPTAQLFHEANAQVKVMLVHRCEDISIQSLQGLKELKILWLDDVHLHGAFNVLPPNLTFMKISDSRLSIQYEGSHSRSIGESREREKKRKRNRPPQHLALRQLEIHASKLLEGSLDSLGQCQALERLDISSLSNWTALPKSLEKLRALEVLRVVSCDQLESLRPLTHLLALKSLVIQDCWRIKAIPKSLGRLKDLEYLVLSSGCFKAPGQALGQLRALRHFESTCCQDWEGFMNWLERVKALTKIVIHSCVRHRCSVIGQIQLQEFLRERSLLQGDGQLQLPTFDKDSFKIIAWPSELLLANFGTLGRARILLIKDCPSLKSLPDILGTFQNLEDLQIVNCGLETLPDTIGDLKALRTLSIVSCNSLKSFPDSIGNLHGLRNLQISCGLLNSPPNYLRQVKGLRLEMTLCRFSWDSFHDTRQSSGRIFLRHLLLQLHSLQTLVLRGCTHESSSSAAQFQFLEFVSRRGLLRGAGQLDLPIFHDERVEISSCNLEQFPIHFHRLRHASSLLLEDCRNFEVLLDTLGEFQALRKIEIKYCRDLESIPDALGNLEALKELSIEDCGSLETLPDSLGQLRALERFVIKSCWGLNRLPDALGKLEALKELRIEHCGSLETLPDSLGQLRALERFVIKSCWGLNRLPDALGKLEALKELSIEDCMSLETLPDSLGQLRALERFVIKSCWDLNRLPDALGKLEALKELSIEDCMSLETLPDSLGQLRALERFVRALERFVIKACWGLNRLPDALGKLEALKELSIEACMSLETLPDSLGQLWALERFVIKSCRGLNRLPDALGKLEALKELSIEDCGSLETLPDSLGQLRALERFVIKSCTSLNRLPDALGKLEALKELRIEYCGSLETLPDSLGQLRALERFVIKSCRGLNRLPDALGKLEALKELRIEDCGSLATLPDSLGQLQALERFVIKSCRGLNRLPDALGKLEALKELSIEDCMSLETLPDSLGNLGAL